MNTLERTEYNVITYDNPVRVGDLVGSFGTSYKSLWKITRVNDVGIYGHLHTRINDREQLWYSLSKEDVKTSYDLLKGDYGFIRAHKKIIVICNV